MTDLWQAQREALGAFIRKQRKQANLSLRQFAELTRLSNAYLSQIERGMYQPSVRVLKAISDALNLSAETLLAEAGLIDAIAGSGPDGKPVGPNPAAPTEEAIRGDGRLSDDQKAALIAVYRSMLGEPAASGDPGSASSPRAATRPRGARTAPARPRPSGPAARPTRPD